MTNNLFVVKVFSCFFKCPRPACRGVSSSSALCLCPFFSPFVASYSFLLLRELRGEFFVFLLFLFSEICVNEFFFAVGLFSASNGTCQLERVE